VRVGSVPAGTEVWLDGERLGYAPGVFERVPSSATEVELRFPDGTVERRAIPP